MPRSSSNVAEGADLDADAGAELIALIEAAQTVEGDRAAVRAATYDTVRAVNTVVRLVLAQARETTAAVRLAADSDKEALADGPRRARECAAWSARPVSVTTRELIVAVLEASDAASSAHQEAQILADAASRGRGRGKRQSQRRQPLVAAGQARVAAPSKRRHIRWVDRRLLEWVVGCVVTCASPPRGTV